MNKFNTLNEMIRTIHDEYAERPHLSWKVDGEWKTKNYKKTTEDVAALTEALVQQGLLDKKIAIYAGNSYEWIISDLAIMSGVGVCVAIDPLWLYEDVNNAIKFTGVKAVLYSEDVKDKVLLCEKDHPEVQFLSMEKDIPRLIRAGRKALKDKEDIFELQKKTTEDSICKMLFTTGTTGMPKVVELSHGNILSTYEGLSKKLHFTEEDTTLMFLPLRHVFASVVIEAWMTSIGMHIFICSHKNKLMQELKETKPTVLLSVPLIFEKVYKEIDKNQKTMIKILSCIPNDWKVKRKVLKKLYDVFGGETKTLISGGAALNEEALRFFNKAGLNLLQGYGATETTGAVCVVDNGKVKEYKSVGSPMSGLSAKILKPDGEIAIKGKQVFTSYYRNKEATEKAFTKGGYYKTGDLGYFDKYGNLCITGRRKRVILTRNGEDVYPDEIEAELNEYQHIHSSKVFQKGNMIVADIYVTKERYIDAAQQFAEEVNVRLPKYKKIKKFNFLDSATKLK